MYIVLLCLVTALTKIKKTALATFDTLAIARLNDAYILGVALINYKLYL